MTDHEDRFNGGFLPPPHANAEVHKRIMRKIRGMSREQLFQTLVDAGIYTQDGELTEPYKDTSNEPMYPDTSWADKRSP